MLSVLLASFSVGATRLAVASSPPSAVGCAYVVRPGDTLWGIASRLDPQGDPRRLVDRVVAMNHVRDGIITPGERLFVP